MLPPVMVSRLDDPVLHPLHEIRWVYTALYISWPNGWLSQCNTLWTATPTIAPPGKGRQRPPSSELLPCVDSKPIASEQARLERRQIGSGSGRCVGTGGISGIPVRESTSPSSLKPISKVLRASPSNLGPPNFLRLDGNLFNGYYLANVSTMRTTGHLGAAHPLL